MKTYQDEQGNLYRIKVHPLLHYIGGNSAPHFSITADIDRYEHGRWYEHSGGCCHDEIERQFPGVYSDLIALHLSDMDGAPSYAEADGWYWLAGCAPDGMGERYHGGNTDYVRESPLSIFARHCRITEAEASAIIDAVRLELGPINEAEGKPKYSKSDYQRARAKWRVICDNMRPRWKQEANACIAKHGLIVTGDAWTPKEAA